MLIGIPIKTQLVYSYNEVVDHVYLMMCMMFSFGFHILTSYGQYTFLTITIRKYKIQPLSACMRVGYTKSTF